MTTWTALSVFIGATHAESISDLLQEYGAYSISLEDAADEPLFQMFPQDMPYWNQIKITALFSEENPENDRHLESYIQLLQKTIAPATLQYAITKIQDQDWVRQTQAHFPVQLFGENLWILPSWCNPPDYAGYVVTIDPGLAFGTGTHPTTSLCLEWLARHPPVNLNVIDYGCGSGILSLAALALGAKAVFAIDHDPQALEATAHNAKNNPLLASRLKILFPDEQNEKINQKSTLIIANLLAEPLFSLVDTFKTLTDQNATLVLSGILNTEVYKVIEIYGSFCQAVSLSTKENWARVVLVRRL